MNVSGFTPIASAIAATERAAATEVARSGVETKTGPSSGGDTSVDPTVQIQRGGGAEDSGADGRQTLDTFERQKDDSKQSAEPQEELIDSNDVPSEVSTDDSQAGRWLDLTG